MKQTKKKVTPVQQKYQDLAEQLAPPRPVAVNCLRAFFVGGIICVIGEALMKGFMQLPQFDEKTAGNPTVAVLVMISVLLTAVGVYDRIAQWAGAGTGVPVTGFANSLSSAAIEHRSEGLVLGIGGNIFKLAGSVIVFGVVAAFVMALIRWVISL